MTANTTRQFYCRWLPIVLVATSLANLVLNEFLPVTSKSYRFHESGSLTHLVHTEQSFLDLHYGIYPEMGGVMGEATLVVPGGPEIDGHSARGLAGVMVVEREYDASDVPERAMPAGPPIGPIQVGDDLLEYWILPGEGDQRWWLGRIPEGMVLIPESVAPVPGRAS